MPATYETRYNIVADYWSAGSAVIPPVDDPDGTVHIQTLKPKIPFNSDQTATFGFGLFFLINTPVDVFPRERYDPNESEGTVWYIHGTGDYYIEVLSKWPLCSEEEVIGWQCLCKRRYTT